MQKYRGHSVQVLSFTSQILLFCQVLSVIHYTLNDRLKPISFISFRDETANFLPCYQKFCVRRKHILLVCKQKRANSQEIKSWLCDCRDLTLERMFCTELHNSISARQSEFPRKRANRLYTSWNGYFQLMQVS